MNWWTKFGWRIVWNILTWTISMNDAFAWNQRNVRYQGCPCSYSFGPYQKFLHHFVSSPHGIFFCKVHQAQFFPIFNTQTCIATKSVQPALREEKARNQIIPHIKELGKFLLVCLHFLRVPCSLQCKIGLVVLIPVQIFFIACFADIVGTPFSVCPWPLGLDLTHSWG